MSKNKLITYIIAVIILFLFPIITIFIQKDTLDNGEEFLFKVEAFDPYDMFRGNYLYVTFKENEVKSEDIGNSYGTFFVTVENDEDGFGYFSKISLSKPKDTSNYYTTNAYYSKYSNCYIINTPYRYYMNEDKAQEAEKIYRENTENTYVKVRVKNGEMVIVGVYVNDILIDTIDNND